MKTRTSCWIGDEMIAAEVRELRSIWARGLGFMGKKRPGGAPGPGSSGVYGYLFRRTGSLHTFFMRFDLDVVYLDAEDRVVKVVRGLRPWRVSLGGAGARHAIEVPAGEMKLDGVKAGDLVEFRRVEVVET